MGVAVPREQILAASADIRAWAESGNLLLDEQHLVGGVLSWSAFAKR